MEKGTSVAEVIRRAVENMVQSSPKMSTQERIRRAIEIAGKFRSGGKNVSRKHDEYLAEAYEQWEAPLIRRGLCEFRGDAGFRNKGCFHFWCSFQGTGIRSRPLIGYLEILINLLGIDPSLKYNIFSKSTQKQRPGLRFWARPDHRW